MVEGLKVACWVTVNVTGILVPPTVFTTKFPVAAPEGTVVTMSVPVQSVAAAIVPATVPPLPLLNNTEPPAVVWSGPKFDPVITTTLPIGAAGEVAPLIALTIGGPEGGVGPVGVLLPHPLRRNIPTAPRATREPNAVRIEYVSLRRVT
jgi:hypothetical protein